MHIKSYVIYVNVNVFNFFFIHINTTIIIIINNSQKRIAIFNCYLFQINALLL